MNTFTINYIFAALIATLGTWFVTALGAATVLFFRRTNQKAMNLMLGFAAGVMIAASFWSLLQPSIEKAEEYLNTPAWIVATSGFLLGAVFMWASDRIVSHERVQFSKNREESGAATNRIIMLVLSITLHNIPEGLAVGVAFGALAGGENNAESLASAIILAVGIGLQNFPEGAAVSLPLRREGYSRGKAFLIGQASGIVEPIAAVIGAAMAVKIQLILPFALAFAAGAMILVAVHELIPECQKNQSAHPYFATTGILSGFATMMLLDVALG
ncbi:MAG: ZIP family metal transporter [Oscillospiraceae bacterium]|nr:ZIP family metal transporter [Oscillospiraceae bacterium]